jgi:hypothetical protein
MQVRADLLADAYRCDLSRQWLAHLIHHLYIHGYHVLDHLLLHHVALQYSLPSTLHPSC